VCLHLPTKVSEPNYNTPPNSVSWYSRAKPIVRLA
jgi:hypothetical protein